VLGAARRERRGVALGGGGPAALGHVGRLLVRGGEKVADRVEPVPVGQPPRCQEGPDVVGLDARPLSAQASGSQQMTGPGHD
jgi:hypothetical protein